MRKETNIHSQLIDKLRDKFIDYPGAVKIPPPIFAKMNGKVLEYNELEMKMNVLFPIDREYCNPFGNMQGGMIAAAIDNTFGPLSMLVAPPNYTRKLEVKYKKPITEKNKYIIVVAQVQEIDEHKLILVASVFDDNENVMVKAKSVHWIL